jgi:endonuclease/exonuclease/phosphatase family metal-dependent hydrolase
VERVHCVLGGDFNCAPSSPLYHFLSKGFLDIDRVDRRALAGSLAFRGASEKNADALADDEFAMLIETGGFDRDDDEWAAWDELRGVRGGSERIETRLRRYFWDDDATRAATGGSFTSRFPTGSETRTTAPKNLRVAHALRGALASCYRAVSADGEEAPVTSWHARFKGTVDYLFHTKGIRTRRVLMPPKSAKDGALPSQEFASDHFCVVADVAFERER